MVTTAEGERVILRLHRIRQCSGNITSQNNRGSFVALDEEVLAAISNTEKRRERAAVRRMPHD